MAMLLALEMEEGGHELRNAGNLQNMKKARKRIQSQSLQEECSLENTLVLAQLDLCWTSDIQNSRIINWYCLSHQDFDNLLWLQQKTNIIILCYKKTELNYHYYLNFIKFCETLFSRLLYKYLHHVFDLSSWLTKPKIFSIGLCTKFADLQFSVLASFKFVKR